MKLNLNLNRSFPDGNNDKAAVSSIDPSSIFERQENRAGSGNVLQEVWGATQKTVRLLQSGSGNGRSSELENKGEATTTECCTSGATNSRRFGNTERKGQFQLVMSELKSRARMKNATRNIHNNNEYKKQGGSPTNIQDIGGSEVNCGHGWMGGRETGKGKTSWSSDEEGGRSGKKWITRTPVFDMVTSRSKKHNSRLRSRSRSTQLGRPSFSPGSGVGGVIPLSKGKGRSFDVMTSEEELMQNGRKGFRLGVDPSSLQRAIGRGILPFKRRQGDERSGSLTNDGGNSTDLCRGEVEAKIEKLLWAIEVCEKKLVGVRMEAGRNRVELGLEVCRLQRFVNSFSKTQELRYQALLEGLDENYRALGQVQSSFDHYFSVTNHVNRKGVYHRLRVWFFFALDCVVGSALGVMQSVTKVYCRYRLRDRGNGNV